MAAAAGGGAAGSSRTTITLYRAFLRLLRRFELERARSATGLVGPMVEPFVPEEELHSCSSVGAPSASYLKTSLPPPPLRGQADPAARVLAAVKLSLFGLNSDLRTLLRSGFRHGRVPFGDEDDADGGGREVATDLALGIRIFRAFSERTRNLEALASQPRSSTTTSGIVVEVAVSLLP